MPGGISVIIAPRPHLVSAGGESVGCFQNRNQQSLFLLCFLPLLLPKFTSKAFEAGKVGSIPITRSNLRSAISTGG